MAHLQLKNRLGAPLRRISVTSSAFTLEPPERIGVGETGQWITTASGAATYGTEPPDPAQAPATQFTLTWEFTEPGQLRAGTRDVARDVRVQVENGPTGVLYTITPHRTRVIPLPPRWASVVIPAVTVFLLLGLAAVAFGANLGGATSRVQDPAATVTATATPTVTPTMTPTITPTVALHGRLAVAPGALALGSFCGDAVTGASLTLANTGDGSLTWEHVPGGAITLSPASGELDAGASMTVSVHGTKTNAPIKISWLDGGQGSSHTEAVALSCVTKVVNFSISPGSASWDCPTLGAYAAPVTLTLNNTGSNVSVGWQITAREVILDPYGQFVPWTTFSATSGTAPAGGAASVTVNPYVDTTSSDTYTLCTRTTGLKDYHADVVLTSGGSGAFNFTYSINGR